MITYSDITNLPGKAISIVNMLNDELINREDCLRLLSSIIHRRQACGIEDHSELITLMERVWNS